MRYPITTGSQAVNAAGPVAGTFDASQLTGDFTIDLNITQLAAGKTMRVAVEDSAAGDFTDALTLAVWSFAGPVLPAATITHSWRRYELSSARVGAANNKLRVNVTSCAATPAAALDAEIDC